ncbi:glycoside hydrolase family 18 protein [Thozetella sp. PMI_491]|nr:glycoside hydrolase family 18 protein [Thozetella sp. PMI_491]
MFTKSLAVAGALAALPQALAGFVQNSQSNIAVYWGQNSFNQETSQSRLSTYCANSNIDIIPVAFVTHIKDPVSVNFANAGNNCSTFAGTQLLSCPQLEEDIKSCQSLGKTILLSFGGATYREGGFSSSSQAVDSANTMWAMFGPVQSGSSVNRPFGSAVVDGFDFDFESGTSNMAPFASQLRSLMDSATASGAKKFYLSAAPQCVYPDYADNDMLNGAVYFDFIMIQYYNNGCGASSYVPGAAQQWNFNFDVWENWASTVSKNPNVRLLLGVPGNTGAGSGYVSGSQLASVVSFVKQYSHFGGVMIWDMSQLYQNLPFLTEVRSDLGLPASGGSSTTLTTTTRASATATSTSATSTATGLVPQWGQCGGEGYTGPTTCVPPYTCVATGAWWSQCQ